jgi:hypothetical protein
MGQHEALGSEGRLIGSYLTGVEPPDELVARYVDASLTLFPDDPCPSDRMVLEFVHRHPWSLPPLEAALGLLRPTSLLRKKIVVLMAILETEPGLAPRFDPLYPGPVGALWHLSYLGLRSAAKLVAGALVYTFLRVRG